MSKCSILVVEDDAVQMRQMARILRADGYIVSEASNGADAIRILEENKANLVLTDRRMPCMDGDSLLAHIRASCPEIPVAVITAYPEGVEDLKPDALLEKPFKGNQLRELVRRLTADRTA